MSRLQLWFLYYLRFLARVKLRFDDPQIIGITGSAGKTSARNAIAAVLKNMGKVKVSYKANSEIGIPLNILGFPPRNYSVSDGLRLAILAPLKLLLFRADYDVYVVEMGIDSPYPPKNMEYLLSIVKPKVGVFLNALAVHSEPFDHLIKGRDLKKREEKARELIANEKGRMIEALPEEGLAVLNADDKYVKAFSKRTKAEVVMIGKGNKNDIRIGEVIQTLSGTKFGFVIGQKKYELNVGKMVLPERYGYTFASSIAVGMHFGLSVNDCVSSLEKNYVLPKGRMSVVQAVGGAIILDSSYNASTDPMVDALRLLDKVAKKRKLALLGDMREMGEEAKLAHRTVANLANEVCDEVYLVGPLMKRYVLPVVEKKAGWFANAKEAVKFIRSRIKKGDVLLVKGSQNELFLEYAVEKLMKNQSKAKKVLCRQAPFWDKKRRQIGLI